MRFFLGTHQPHWLGDEAFAGVDLFIVVGAGAVVTRNVPTNMTVAGMPARAHKRGYA